MWFCALVSHWEISLVFPEALQWVKMLWFHAEAQFLPPIPCSGAHWWASSPVRLGEERHKLTRIGIKVPLGWILSGCGVEMVLGIPVGYTWEVQGGSCSAGTNWKPIYPIQTPLINGSLINCIFRVEFLCCKARVVLTASTSDGGPRWVLCRRIKLETPFLSSTRWFIFSYQCQVVCWEAYPCSPSSWVHNFICFIPHISEFPITDSNSA